MTQGVDLSKLLSAGELDPQTIENLRQADRREIEKTLKRFLPDAEVDRILHRIEELLRTPDRP